MSLTGQLLSASKYLESQLGGALWLEAGQLEAGPKGMLKLAGTSLQQPFVKYSESFASQLLYHS